MRKLKLLLLSFIFCFAGLVHAEQGGQVLTFGIITQQSPTELAKLWGPVCQYLSKQTGYQIQFKTSKDLDSFWKDTSKGAFDIIYVSSPRYVYANTKPGYVAFAKVGESPLVVIIVARKDGPANIKELKGRKLAVPSLNALAAQLSDAYLRKNGIDVSLIAVNSHDSVYKTVEKGLYPAGTSNLHIFGMLESAKQAEFRMLWQSDPLPPFAFAAHPRVSPEAINNIQQALLKMDDDSVGRKLLAMLNVKAIVAANDSDYNVMRKLKIKLE